MKFFKFFEDLNILYFSETKKKKHKNENPTKTPLASFYSAKQQKKITLCDHGKNF